jgi:3-methyladenine DNA glycosylase/8-oxoguanine DNA glycosylase
MALRQVVVRPKGPFSLALSARLVGDATRRMDDRGVLTAVVPGENGPVLAQAWQQPDGPVVLRAPDDAALDRLRFVLAIDADHSPFLRIAAEDALLRRASLRLQGLRPLRTATVAQALLRAFCGQLIESSRARAIERRIIREVTPAVGGGGLHAAPTGACLTRRSPAELRRSGLHARRGAALVRICTALDLERLHGQPTGAVATRLLRERSFGPWSLGVVCLEGLGRTEHGLVGDLGLVKLLGDLRGRRAEPAETAELLEPYGEWAGLASVYLLNAYGAGLLPLPERARVRMPPARFRIAESAT